MGTLYSVGGVTDPKVLQAALLQFVVEETTTTLADIKEYFGIEIQRIVAELTEDKTLPKDQRRRLALLKIERASTAAKLIKLATLLHDLDEMVLSPRPDWSLTRFRERFSYVREVNECIRGTNISLETAIDSLLHGKFRFHHQELPLLPESLGGAESAMAVAKAASVREGVLFAAGVSLVDISVEVTDDFAARHRLVWGSEYLSSDLTDRVGLSEEVEKLGKKTISNSGGSSFNTLRVAQWLLHVEKACTLTGISSNDAYGQTIRRFASHSHINYIAIAEGKGETYTRLNLSSSGRRIRILQFDPLHPVVLSDTSHSDIRQRLQSAKVVFMTATFIHMQPQEALFIARDSLTAGKHLALNVEGACMCDSQTRFVLEEVLTYVYAVFGDENGYRLMADKLGWKCRSAEAVLNELAKLPRFTFTKQRIAFCLTTRNEKLILADNVVHSEPLADVKNPSSDWLVDATAGAFLGELSQGKNFSECLLSSMQMLRTVSLRTDMNLPEWEAVRAPACAADAEQRFREKLTLGILRKLPKAELHCHLDGSVRVSTVIELAKEQNVKLPVETVPELKKLVTVGKDCPSLVEYLRGFQITLLVMQKKYAITRCMYEVCEDAAADGVRYIEVRFSPILHTDEGLSLSGVMDAVCEGAVMAENSFNITARIIVCGMRHLPAATTEKLAEIAWRYQNRGVVGFDLAGPENGFSSTIHKSAFDIVRGHLLNCTLHSGEAAGWESVMDSIVHCGARRIGHGVRMRENSKLVDFVVDHRIPVESCVTSNLQTKAVASLKEHPFREYFDRGVVIVPSTDNVTVSGVTLSSEFLLIQDAFDMKPHEILRLIDYGFRSAFLNISHKKRLRAESMHLALSILRDEGFDLSEMHQTTKFGEGFSLSSTENDDDVYSFENLRARASVHFFSSLKRGAGWGKANPPLTVELMTRLPKADVDTRLDGSVSIETLWKMYSALVSADSSSSSSTVVGLPSPPLSSIDDLRRAIQGHEHSEASDNAAKALMNAIIQTEEQIAMAVDDVLSHAIEENFIYMELHVRPLAHLKRGLTAEEVLLVVLRRVKTVCDAAVGGISVGVVVCVEPHSTPTREAVLEVVNLAIKYRDLGVCGFGFFGPDGAWTSSDQYAAAFDLLKANSVNVSCSAGRDKSAISVVDALYKAGASRISGGFLVHKDPSLVNFLANYSIPVEMNMTENMLKGTADVSTFAGNVIRLYLDNQIKVTVCAFDKTLYPQSRSETLVKVAEVCNLEIHELVEILTTGFRRCFQSRSKRKEMYRRFWDSSLVILDKAGFQHFRESHYFAPKMKRKKAREATLHAEERKKISSPFG